ncbi:lysozyme inhibitor LprI family protein [Achromobacter sp. MFA1 R4]|uniref:lysozyme inhibitor LprI family protein n=1 Tax=Achromobacter sp. MFA1 R4 TaxID=1881016 RepID=UPI001E447096|nr:lysozyme inhibitor LprI family protein [Achromobacter sp. MFA1 R4]
MAADGVQTEQELYAICSADSQAGMRDCLARAAEESGKALVAAQRQAAAALDKWDEERQYVDQAKARLAASNRAFAEYRSAQCEWSASMSGGAAGNAHEMGKLACVAELNQRRARQLREAVEDLPLK